LIEKLSKLGLDEGQIDKLTKQLGVTEEADLAYLEPSDLEALGVPIVRARRIIGEAVQAGQTKVEETTGLMPGLASALTNLAGALAKKPIGEWSIAELIAGLISEPDNDLLREEIESRNDYVRAHSRTKAILARKDGVVDPITSQKYIRSVAKGGPVLDQFEGHQMVTPELAFGQKITKWHHPLIVNWVITNGVDEAGLTWESKDLPRIRMAIWARDFRRHPLFPRDPDPVNEHSALTSENLVGRWSQIWQAYQLWLEEGNEEPNVNVREVRDAGSMPPFGSVLEEVVSSDYIDPRAWWDMSFPQRNSYIQLIEGLSIFDTPQGRASVFNYHPELRRMRFDPSLSPNIFVSNLFVRMDEGQYHMVEGEKRYTLGYLFSFLATQSELGEKWRRFLTGQLSGQGGDVVIGPKYVIGGDNRGATFNIGSTIIGGRQDK
jgi:hypothetical protein